MRCNLGLLFEKILAKVLRKLSLNNFAQRRISQFFFQELVSQIRITQKRHDILYLRSDSLYRFLSQGVPTHRVIVAGGTDHDITKSEYETMNSFSSTIFFVQNLDFPETSNVFFLPIGVEDLSWGKNGMPWNFRRKFTKQTKIRKVLIGPFGNTHKARIDCLRAGMSSRHSKVLLERLPSWKYASLSSKYMFVACPRGNGLDTHRFWETLYRGSLPVVIESPHSSNLQHYQVPHVPIRQWELLDLATVTAHVGSREMYDDVLNPEWWRMRILSHLAM